MFCFVLFFWDTLTHPLHFWGGCVVDPRKRKLKLCSLTLLVMLALALYLAFASDWSFWNKKCVIWHWGEPGFFFLFHLFHCFFFFYLCWWKIAVRYDRNFRHWLMCQMCMITSLEQKNLCGCAAKVVHITCAMSLRCFCGCCTSRWMRPMDFYGKHLSKCGRNKRLLKHWVKERCRESKGGQPEWGDEWFSSEMCRVQGRVEEWWRRKAMKNRRLTVRSGFRWRLGTLSVTSCVTVKTKKA